ncbi:ribose-phosphate pyrophosphokinase [Candidatus Microgenomates bacterium]|nr:ribose-phosphate pyrophosphokinase [Candidatus Microgenomates bacterium]
MISNDFLLMTGRSNPKLAFAVGKILKKEVCEPISVFSDGEIRVRIKNNMRRRHVYIIQPTSPRPNDAIMELILMIDAARRGSASEIIAIIPYFGYARQDRKEMSRVPISAAAVASMIEYAGANRILTIDIHSEQQEGFAKCPWDNIYGSYSLLPEIKKKKLTNLVVASPDKGGVVRATGYARLLSAEGIAIVYKERDLDISNKSQALSMVGNVKDKNVLVVDDMLDTGGTLLSAADFIKSRGAKSVRAAVTHGLFSGEALDKVDKSAVDEVIVTDTVTLREEVIKHPKTTVVSVAPLLSSAIKHIESGESLSSDLILKPSETQ